MLIIALAFIKRYELESVLVLIFRVRGSTYTQRVIDNSLKSIIFNSNAYHRISYIQNRLLGHWVEALVCHQQLTPDPVESLVHKIRCQTVQNAVFENGGLNLTGFGCSRKLPSPDEILLIGPNHSGLKAAVDGIKAVAFLNPSPEALGYFSDVFNGFRNLRLISFYSDGKLIRNPALIEFAIKSCDAVFLRESLRHSAVINNLNSSELNFYNDVGLDLGIGYGANLATNVFVSLLSSFRRVNFVGIDCYASVSYQQWYLDSGRSYSQNYVRESAILHDPLRNYMFISALVHTGKIRSLDNQSLFEDATLYTGRIQENLGLR